MSLVFLVFTNLVLITRLWCHVREGGVNWRLWGTKMAIELAGLSLFEWHAWLLAAAATVVVMNVAGVLWEALGWRRNAGHFALGLIYLLALSVWFSPAFGLRFWPVVEAAVADFGQWTAFEAIFQSSFSTTAMLVLFGLLVAMSEMNLAVRAVFDYLDLKPRAAADSEEVDVDRLRPRPRDRLSRAGDRLFLRAGRTLRRRGLRPGGQGVCPDPARSRTARPPNTC